MGRAVADVLSREQHSALERLSLALDPSTYLAGGVAVGLYLGHRRSLDLDLFSTEADPNAIIQSLASGSGALRILSRASGTLYLEVEGVPASIIRYSYPLVARLETFAGLGVAVAALEDLACMKLSAIASRGAARDFWDLHEILRSRPLGLEDALELYRQKYATEDIGHVVRSLVYFADAEKEPRPIGLTVEIWRQIKRDLRTSVARLPSEWPTGSER